MVLLLENFITIVEEQTVYKGDKINELLFSVLEEISPDELIRVGPSMHGGKSTTLLHILSGDDRTNYQLLFQNRGRPIRCNIMDSDEYTPLHCACNNGNKNAVKLLLEHGADPNIGTYLWGSPLTQLLSRVRDGTREILKLLVHYKADINKATDLY